MKTFLLALLVTAALAEVTFVPITDLSQVPNGDAYNMTLPVASPTLFAGKKIAMLVSDFAEDCEVYYEYDYFKRRGADIEILTPNGGDLTIADFVKPDYIIANTIPIRDRVNTDYFMVYVSGGSPSSYAMRVSSEAQALMWRQYAANRWLAVICSGSETLIEIGLTDGQHITGSPTSRRVLEMVCVHTSQTHTASAEFESVKQTCRILMPARPSPYHPGGNQSDPCHGMTAGAHYHLVPVVRNGHLITGQGPTFSFHFALAIDQAVQGTQEGECDLTSGLTDQAEIDPAVFRKITSVMEIANGTDVYPADQPAVTSPTQFQQLKVAMIVSHTSSRFEVEYVQKYFTARGATVDYFGPFWQVSGGVVLSEYMRPVTLVKGAQPAQATSTSYDVAVVVGGASWSSTVLSNDDGTAGLLWSLHNQGALLVGMGTGAEVLGAANLLKGTHVTGWWTTQKNLQLYGALYQNVATVYDPATKIFTCRGPWEMSTCLSALGAQLVAGPQGPSVPMFLSVASLISIIATFIITAVAFILSTITCIAVSRLKQNTPLAFAGAE
ncbi:hypothetical protein PAPYR_1665 [Paratrimastix pyriformis]|uniref:DJ-1/PfpI domain-containing protein n=1 Tax=Paratrimastix pyriformis TaxID=342808 RepID=A0ABQ8UU51_9EUKA|nr:hypothetical protein PAPYR_1665 [Paratrimastix pyriformis]